VTVKPRRTAAVPRAPWTKGTINPNSEMIVRLCSDLHDVRPQVVMDSGRYLERYLATVARLLSVESEVKHGYAFPNGIPTLM
jgi:hypothetical protein